MQSDQAHQSTIKSGMGIMEQVEHLKEKYNQVEAHTAEHTKKIFFRQSTVIEQIKHVNKSATLDVQEIECYAREYAAQVDENDDEHTIIKKSKIRAALLSLDAINETISNLEKEVSIFRTTHEEAMDNLNAKILTVRDLMGSLENVQNQVGYLNALIEGKRINYERKRNVLIQERQLVLKDKSITEQSRKSMIIELDRRLAVIKEMYDHELSICKEQLALYKRNVFLKKDLIAVGLLAEYEALQAQMKNATVSEMSMIRTKIAAIRAEMLRKEIEDLEKEKLTATSSELLAILEKIEQLTQEMNDKIEKEGARAIGTKIVHTDVEGKMFYINEKGVKTYRLEAQKSDEYVLDISLVILQYYRPKVNESDLELVQRADDLQTGSGHSSDLSITSSHSDTGLHETECRKYLENNMKRALVKGFTLCLQRNPPDHVQFLVEYLRAYKFNCDKQDMKTTLLSQLKKARLDKAQQTKALGYTAATFATIRKDTPINEVDCYEAFDELTNEEKLFAHYSSLACWHGGLIILFQRSRESPIIFSLLLRIFQAEPLADLRSSCEQEAIDFEHFEAFLIYACGVFFHMGNYRGAVPYKFVPNVPPDVFYQIIQISEAYRVKKEHLDVLWNICHPQMFTITPETNNFGIGVQGVTTYYSRNITEEDIELIKSWVELKKIRTPNCRIFKFEDKNGRTVFDIKAASVRRDMDVKYTFKREMFKRNVFKFSRGDHNLLLEKVVEHLTRAQQNCTTPKQSAMMADLLDHFQTGSMAIHDQMVTNWLRTRNPKIEISLGFNKDTMDPTGVMSEFIGFVGITNKITNALFKDIVGRVGEIRPLLPWSPDFEKKVFFKPDFTILELLTFSASKFPDVLNIPDYHMLTATEGSKVVCLTNLMSNDESELLFLSEEDKEGMLEYQNKACIVQVAIKEIIGHGCGKLFIKKKDGTFNFDASTVINPITKKHITSWYEHNETYETAFKDIAISYEECRAECIGLYLVTFESVLEYLGYEDEEADNICYIYWLNFIWTSLFKGTLMYNSQKRQWKNPLSRARYVITRMLIEKAEGLITVTESETEPVLLVHLDGSKLRSVGKSALEEFLIKIQTYKSINNFHDARILFNRYSQVEMNLDDRFQRWRQLAIEKIGEKPMFVQANTILDRNKEVTLKTYFGSPSGFIESYVDRYSIKTLDTIETIWQSNSQHFTQD